MKMKIRMMVATSLLISPAFGASAAPQNSMAPLADRLAHEMQTLAIYSQDVMNPDNVSEGYLMRVAADRLRAGDSANDVAAGVRELRDVLRRLDDECDPLHAALAGSIGCGVVLSSLGIPALAASVTVPVCGAFAGRWYEDRCQARQTTGDISDLLQTFKGNRGWRGVWTAAGFEDETAVWLDDEIETVLERHRTMAEHLTRHGIDVRRAISSGVADLSDLILEAREQSAELLDEMREISRSQRRVLDFAELDFAEAWVHEEIKRAAETRRRANRANIVAARTALGGAMAVARSAGMDASISTGILALGDFGVGAYDAVEIFNDVITAGGNSTLASLALSGNFAGLTLGFVGSILDTGPSADEIIIEELGKLRQQMTELRTEMHGRFDGVHEHLDLVIDTLEGGFSALSADVADLRVRLEIMHGDLLSVSHRVDRLARGLDYTYVNLSDEHEQLMLAVTGTTTINCTDATRLNVTASFLQDCRSHFENLAAVVAGDQIEAQSGGGGMLSVDLARHPDRTTNVSFQEFSRLLRQADRTSDGLPASVVGPEAWMELMDRQSEFLVHHSDVAEDLGVELSSRSFVATMRSHRVNLRRYLNAVVEELRVFAGIDELRETAFSAQFGEVRNNLVLLAREIDSITGDYYSDPELFDGRTLQGDDDGSIPEVRYEQSPYDAWRPMRHFYRPDRYPSWLRIQNYVECTRWLQNSADVRQVSFWSAGQWMGALMRGDGILRFVHENDLLPARIGLGTIDVCAVGMFRNTDSQDAVAFGIRFMPVEGVECPETDMMSETRFVDDRDIESFLTAAVEMPAPESLLPVAESETSGCRQAYEERFKEERGALSDHVRRELPVDVLQGVDRVIKMANAHLRSWLALALDDARRRSETVATILSGDVGYPDLEQLLRGEHPWDATDRALQEVDQLESVLRSQAMRDAVTYGARHQYLTELRYPSLDLGRR